MKKLIAVLTALLILSCSLFASSAEIVYEPAPRDGVGMSIAGFTSRDLYNNPINDSILANADVTVINFWATWCGPCIGEMPDFQRLHEYYQGTPEADVQLYGLLMYDYSDEIPEAIEICDQYGFTWPHILMTPLFYSIAEALVGDGSVPVPQTIIVDRSGTVRAHKRGRFIDYEEMYEYVSYWYDIISAEQPPIVPGDADGNGQVTIADAVLALRCSMSLIGESDLNFTAADIDGDGRISVADAVSLLRISMGLA